jgi:hypothetical protein
MTFTILTYGRDNYVKKNKMQAVEINFLISSETKSI